MRLYVYYTCILRMFLSSFQNMNNFTDIAKAGLEKRGASCAPVIICQRVAFSHSVIDGQTALEFEPSGRAAEEVRELYGWICGHIGMSTRQQDQEQSTERRMA